MISIIYRCLRWPCVTAIIFFIVLSIGPSAVTGADDIKKVKRLVARLQLELSQVKEKELRELKLGYRAKYVCGVASILNDEPTFLSTIINLPYSEAKSKLVSLPGVGPKIADCALLFGAKKSEAFPVDTWIAKTLDRHYNLESFTPVQKIIFARSHFGKFCGLAQQFLFSGERLGLIK